MRRYRDILEFRKALGLSQRQAAKMLGITHGYLSRITRGLQRPGVGTLIKFQEHLIKTEPFLSMEMKREN